MKQFLFCLTASLFACTSALAQGAISFEGKTITMVVGYAPGGGTDAAGRLIAAHLGKFLPGKPTIVVQNVPGANGITAMNFMAQQVKPDGLTLTMGSSTVADPMNYRKPQARFDPTQFPIIGGIGRGGSTILISKAAETRLFDKNQPPVVMGSVGGMPRSGMQTTAWGIDVLGWNAKWVLGYRGTNDLFIALERGEIDMAATSNRFQVAKLLESGKFKILTQTGTLENGRVVARSEFGDVPVFLDSVEGKVTDPIQKKAFDYWFGLVTLDKWLALPPATPAAVIETYREAFGEMVKDPEFLETGKSISEDFEPQAGPDVEKILKQLASTPAESFEYIPAMLRKQGLDPQ